jgi:hypothetical protein
MVKQCVMASCKPWLIGLAWFSGYPIYSIPFLHCYMRILIILSFQQSLATSTLHIYIYTVYIYKCLFSSHSSIKHPRRQGIFFSAKRRICSRARRRILGRTVTRIGSCIPCDKWRYIIWISLDALWEWWFAIIPTLIFGWWTRIYPDECS